METRSSHPGFYERARDVIASQGLAPGFPQQFSYVEVTDHPTHITRDQVPIHVNGETGILQAAVREPTIGQYRSMVEDIPFDPGYETAQAQNVTLLGFGALIVAILSMGW